MDDIFMGFPVLLPIDDINSRRLAPQQYPLFYALIPTNEAEAFLESGLNVDEAGLRLFVSLDSAIVYLKGISHEGLTLVALRGFDLDDRGFRPDEQMLSSDCSGHVGRFNHLPEPEAVSFVRAAFGKSRHKDADDTARLVGTVNYRPFGRRVRPQEALFLKRVVDLLGG